MSSLTSVIVDSVAGVFGRAFTYFASMIPPGTGMILLTAFVFAFIIGVFVYFRTRPTKQETTNQQAVTFQGVYDALAAKRKGVDEYLKEALVRTSMNNWVLLNFAPLTVVNAGYEGPAVDGYYSTKAIRDALDLGFRSFVFHIDYYKGEPKDPNNFVPPGDPCLLHRDDQGVIRSANCGRISEMMQALAEQAFSRSLATGNDPLLVTLLFKTVPDRIAEPGIYANFLSKVSQEIQPLRQSFLARIDTTRFSNLENPSAVFVQPFEQLKGKTIIFTNANTDLFKTATITDPTKNLRFMINAQVYSTSGSSIEKDTVTEPAPQGTQMAVGLAKSTYFLETPPDRMTEATRKTNNVFTLVSTPDANTNYSVQAITDLSTKFGVQSIGWNLYTSPTETQDFFNKWGAFSWKLKPPALQYIVVRPAPPKVLSPNADANQGNPRPPALHF